MQRFGLRDDQWERIKDFLPGREGHVGRTDHAQERKARIITAVKGGLILSPQSQFAVVSQEGNK